MAARTQKRKWLLPAVLILFLLEVLLFPQAVGLTYSGRSESPDHILTYTTGRLTWDSATNIQKNGAAELTLFDAVYRNVESDNGDKVVAPGTEGFNVVRLKNNVSRSIRYVAVMYCIKDEDALPIEPTLTGQNLTNTRTYPLPKGVTDDQVVRAVTGVVRGGEIQDFDIEWSWEFYENDERDRMDTELGDRAAFATADEITAGIYIVVEDEGPNRPGGSNHDDDDDGDDDWEDIPDENVPGGETPWPDGGDDPNDSGNPDAPDEWTDIPDEDTPLGENPGGGDHPGDTGGPYITPDVPKTGDDSPIGVYLVLVGISAVLLILVIWDDRREKRK